MKSDLILKIKRLRNLIFLHLSRLPMSGNIRWRFVRLGGVKFTPKPTKVRIYDGVIFDSIYPELVSIGNGVAIASGCKIITHFMNPSIIGNSFSFKKGSVIIKDNVFIGMNVIICNSVTVGEGAVIGAGSVVTRDIPPYQVWAGNPARFIKNRG